MRRLFEPSKRSHGRRARRFVTLVLIAFALAGPAGATDGGDGPDPDIDLTLQTQLRVQSDGAAGDWKEPEFQVRRFWPGVRMQLWRKTLTLRLQTSVSAEGLRVLDAFATLDVGQLAAGTLPALQRLRPLLKGVSLVGGVRPLPLLWYRQLGWARQFGTDWSPLVTRFGGERQALAGVVHVPRAALPIDAELFLSTGKKLDPGIDVPVSGGSVGGLRRVGAEATRDLQPELSFRLSGVTGDVHHALTPTTRAVRAALSGAMKLHTIDALAPSHRGAAELVMLAAPISLHFAGMVAASPVEEGVRSWWWGATTSVGYRLRAFELWSTFHLMGDATFIPGAEGTGSRIKNRFDDPEAELHVGVNIYLGSWSRLQLEGSMGETFGAEPSRAHTVRAQWALTL